MLACKPVTLVQDGARTSLCEAVTALRAQGTDMKAQHAEHWATMRDRDFHRGILLILTTPKTHNGAGWNAKHAQMHGPQEGK